MNEVKNVIRANRVMHIEPSSSHASPRHAASTCLSPMFHKYTSNYLPKIKKISFLVGRQEK